MKDKEISQSWFDAVSALVRASQDAVTELDRKSFARKPLARALEDYMDECQRLEDSQMTKLIPLSVQEIKGLQENDETEYHVKLVRLYDPEPKTVWEGKSKLSILRTKATKRQSSELALITPKGRGWAEGSASDVCPLFENGALVPNAGCVVVEDYEMVIYREGDLQ